MADFKRENAFQNASAELFRRLGWLAWHTPNERKDKMSSLHMSRAGVMPGVSDWFVCERWEKDGESGFGVFIELKTAKGRVSQAQERFLSQVQARGCLGVVVRSWEELLEAIKLVKPANGRTMR